IRGADGLISGVTAGGVRQQREALGVDEVEDGITLARQAHAPHGNGDDLRAGFLVRLAHDVVARVLAGADDQPRGEVLAAQHQIRVVHLNHLHTSSRTCQISWLGSARDAPHLAPPLALPPPMGRTISTRSPSRSATEAYVAFGVISRLTATAVYSRFTARWASNASTLSPSATSISRPFTVIFMETKTAAPPSRVRPRLFASCSLRPHYRDQVRGVPGRTRFSGILPPRRQREYTPAPFDFTAAGCYLVRHSSRPPPRLQESVPMNGTTRRQFL